MKPRASCHGPCRRTSQRQMRGNASTASRVTAMYMKRPCIARYCPKCVVAGADSRPGKPLVSRRWKGSQRAKANTTNTTGSPAVQYSIVRLMRRLASHWPTATLTTPSPRNVGKSQVFVAASEPTVRASSAKAAAYSGLSDRRRESSTTLRHRPRASSVRGMAMRCACRSP